MRPKEPGARIQPYEPDERRARPLPPALKPAKPEPKKPEGRAITCPCCGTSACYKETGADGRWTSYCQWCSAEGAGRA